MAVLEAVDAVPLPTGGVGRPAVVVLLVAAVVVIALSVTQVFRFLRHRSLDSGDPPEVAAEVAGRAVVRWVGSLLW